MASHAEVINDLRARAKPLLASHAGNQLLAKSMLRAADHMADLLAELNAERQKVAELEQMTEEAEDRLIAFQQGDDLFG